MCVFFLSKAEDYRFPQKITNTVNILQGAAPESAERVLQPLGLRQLFPDRPRYRELKADILPLLNSNSRNSARAKDSLKIVHTTAL